MTSAQALRSAKAFLESYRTAFERLDATAIADHFAYPGHITSDAGEAGDTGDKGDVVLDPIATRQDWIGQLERLLAGYRDIGFASARVVDLAATELSPRLMQVLVHWALVDGAGKRLYVFEASYTLATIDAGLRITAIAHNEIPRYRECVARLRSQRSAGNPRAAR